LDFLGAQGAAVSEFADLSALGNLSNTGSGGEFEFGGDGADFLDEKGGDLVLISQSSSGQVADQSSVALSGFSAGNEGESGILVFFGRSLSTAGQSSSQDKTLEKGNTSKESQRSGSSRSDSNGSTSSGSSSAGEDESGLSDSSAGKSNNGELVHVDCLEVEGSVCVPAEF